MNGKSVSFVVVGLSVLLLAAAASVPVTQDPEHALNGEEKNQAEFLFGPTHLDHEQVFLKITNHGPENATFTVRYDEVILDQNTRYGFVHSLIDPEGDWSGDCPAEPWDPAVAEPGTPLYWGVAISPGFTCAYLPDSELIGGVGVVGEEVSVPVVPLGDLVALHEYNGHELTFEAPPGENHFLTGPLWFEANVSIVAEDPNEPPLESELILRDQGLFRYRNSVYKGDWDEAFVKAWAVNTGAMWIRTQEEIRHPYNIFFFSSSSVATHQHSAQFPDGTSCTKEPGDIPIISSSHMPTGTVEVESIFAKTWGLYPPYAHFFIYDISLPHDNDTRGPLFCEDDHAAPDTDGFYISGPGL